HLGGGADEEMPADDVEDSVDVGKDRVDLVGDEDDGGVALDPLFVQECGDDLLVVHVQRQQRFVAQQHRGVVGQGLGDSQPLQLTAGDGSRRSMGVVGGTDG